MDGRVKTLHPHIHGGLLARRGVDDAVLESHGIGVIDVLVVNLYPFEATTARPDCTDAEAIENIDVGGPAMLRAAAKNHEHITVVVDPADYDPVLAALKDGGVPPAMRRQLAIKAFSHTARYDTAISHYLRTHSPTPDEWAESAATELGPVATAALRRKPSPTGGALPNGRARTGLRRARAQVAGQGALVQQPRRRRRGVSSGESVRRRSLRDREAREPVRRRNGRDAPSWPISWRTAADPTSAFGGVIAFNRPLDQVVGGGDRRASSSPRSSSPRKSARRRSRRSRRNQASACSKRVGRPHPPRRLDPSFELKTIEGGLLVQTADDGRVDIATAKVVDATRSRRPTSSATSKFAWTVVKYVKSNAIVLARDDATIGIGAGQPSRVMSARIAALKAEEAKLDVAGSVLASDAFFPFRDGIDAAAERGVRRRRATRRLDARRRSHTRRRRARHRHDLHGHAALSPLTTERTQ